MLTKAQTASPTIPRLRLSRSHRDDWTCAALAINYPDWHDLAAWGRFRACAADLAEQYLPRAVQAALESFFSPSGSDYMIVEGLPVDPALPPVPLDGVRPAGKQPVSEAVIAGLIGRRAEIFSYTEEKAGCPIQELTPIPGLETSQSNAGRRAMNYHTDGAFLPSRFRPRGLVLFGLANSDTATLVLPAEQIASVAPYPLLATLAQDLFLHACPLSFSCSIGSQPSPILWRNHMSKVCIAVASSSIEPVNDAARHALKEFRALCAQVEPTRIVVGPGTALLFRNDRVLHGRDPVRQIRWLQRAYFAESLALFRHAAKVDPSAFCFDVASLLESP